MDAASLARAVRGLHAFLAAVLPTLQLEYKTGYSRRSVTGVAPALHYPWHASSKVPADNLAPVGSYSLLELTAAMKVRMA